MDVRLLAPRAELRLQVAGGSSMIDAGRLSYLGEALRALLVMEVGRRHWCNGHAAVCSDPTHRLGSRSAASHRQTQLLDACMGPTSAAAWVA